MADHVFTGFGFGPIQAGLFVNEAFKSGRFGEIVIAEIDQVLVDAVRSNGGSYVVNVAKSDGIEIVQIDGVEILNPMVEEDKKRLIEVLSRSTEIVTSLPSASFYVAGAENSVAYLIGEGLRNSKAAATIVYTAENNNAAAEILEEKVGEIGGCSAQFLNTVIGKMSQVVTNRDEINHKNFEPMVPGLERAFLVEEFNRILVSKCLLDGFEPGIEVFIEKENLLPFEEAKLYGHNAIHAVLAYLGALKGYTKMTELADDKEAMKIARDAFLKESGNALIKKYGSSCDDLFTEVGYKEYAFDLLERITNPYLADTIERAGRDPVRKLGYNDRIFGTMAMALEYGIEPENMAFGAMAAIAVIQEFIIDEMPADLRFDDWRKIDDSKIENIIKWIWSGQSGRYGSALIKLAQKAPIAAFAGNQKNTN